MAAKKRTAQPTAGPSKKRKLAAGQNGPTKKAKSKGKEKAADREIIPIPSAGDQEDVELSDQDLEFFEEFGGAAGFLTKLDQKGISKSKKEIRKLHEQHKPVRAQVKDDLPSIDSQDEDEDEDDWSSGFGSDANANLSMSEAEDDLESDGASSSSERPKRRKGPQENASDAEMEYEAVPRRRQPEWDSESEKDEGIERLPIKLADGRVQKTKDKVYLPREASAEDESSESEEEHEQPRPVVEDVSTGARFGRPAVIDVIGQKSRKKRVQLAKEQIASICQEIVADPENSLGLLRRLHTFSLPEISTPTHPDPVPNDPIVRKLTILSQLAVFKDIIPGYRIRALTDKEKAEKVSQMVQRTRDWEQGLVSVYQQYLRVLDAEVKAKSELAETALQCMCTLLVDVTHFNFRVNIMSTVVACLSRKSWDKTSDLCLNALIKVFRADLTGVPSLEIVRLLNRMIKERKFNVHPEVLSCLLHLRLKTELGVRASDSKADKAGDQGPGGKKLARSRAAAKRAKGKNTDQPHLSKKARKTLKESQEIEKEMREAAAEVDKEEREANQTETLKLLFVLYFRILKNPHPTPLLPAALQGIAKFAHLVNIDFFKDLMKVLRELMHRTSDAPHGEDSSAPAPTDTREVQHQLLCIVTAFELLSGQGEALDIDLTDFVNRLYAMIPSLCLQAHIETPPPIEFVAEMRVSKPSTTSDMLFRALQLAFSPRTSAGSAPPWRSAAFAKRLLTASLHWPSATVLRAIDFVLGLVERDFKLEALLSTEDRSVDGVYRPDLDDPQLCNPFGTSFWELHLLSRTHWDAKVREAARRLLNFGTAS
ncbi:nucleolar complex-associated protein 3 [Panus rudis PR-1116 ss-1]|nr:nucleolar complex-associated protein 3 [Panus rudis PR-1116 ss-1]